MAPSKVKVDEDLAALAAEVAEERGETVEIVIDRMLRAYVERPDEDGKRHAADA